MFTPRIEDGFDETIFPVDYEKEGEIVDDELFDVLIKPMQKGGKFSRSTPETAKRRSGSLVPRYISLHCLLCSSFSHDDLHCRCLSLGNYP